MRRRLFLFGLLLSGTASLQATDYTLLATPTTVEWGHYAADAKGTRFGQRRDTFRVTKVGVVAGCIVLDGTLHIAVDARRMDLKAGESITVARGVAHAWCNASRMPVHMLAVFSPGGIEQLFREIPNVDPADIPAIIQRYGTRLIGPPLEQTIYSINSPRS